jgi:anti-sigma regulatory factor (Ser/Thr protein kinase)
MTMFPPTTASASAARRYVWSRLVDRQGDLPVDTIVLLADELATNAIVHTHQPFDLDVRLQRHGVKVVVSDTSHVALPPVTGAQPDDLGGRGLPLIDALADAWGWQPTDAGKSVWFCVGYGPQV